MKAFELLFSSAPSSAAERFASLTRFYCVEEASAILAYELGYNASQRALVAARLVLLAEEEAERTTTSRVYFIQSGGAQGPIKIGRAEDVDARLRELQTGNPQKLTLLATMRGGRAAERTLHARFRTSRIRGEWFVPSPELLEVIEHAAEVVQ